MQTANLDFNEMIEVERHKVLLFSISVKLPSIPPNMPNTVLSSAAIIQC